MGVLVFIILIAYAQNALQPIKIKYMTQIAAMSKSLLRGEVLSVMNCFKWFGVTNCAREMGRSIERKFGVKLSRVRIDTTTRYGTPAFFYQYRLNQTDYNKEGIEKMKAYISEIENQPFNPPVKRGAKTITPKKEVTVTGSLFN